MRVGGVADLLRSSVSFRWEAHAGPENILPRPIRAIPPIVSRNILQAIITIQDLG